LLTPGARNYWQSHNFETLPDELFDEVIHAVNTIPAMPTEIFIAAMRGAASRTAPHATAYAQPGTRLALTLHTRRHNPSDDERCIAWARGFYRAAARFATGGVYVNFVGNDETERVRAAYGSNYNRLARVKRVYDPANLFRVNQNIQPE